MKESTHRNNPSATVGETFDVEFSSALAQDLLLDLLLPGQKIHTTQTLSFQPESPGTR